MIINAIFGLLAAIFILVILLCILAGRVAHLEGKVLGLFAIANDHHEKIDTLFMRIGKGGTDDDTCGTVDDSEEKEN